MLTIYKLQFNIENKFQKKYHLWLMASSTFSWNICLRPPSKPLVQVTLGKMVSVEFMVCWWRL